MHWMHIRINKIILDGHTSKQETRHTNSLAVNQFRLNIIHLSLVTIQIRFNIICQSSNQSDLFYMFVIHVNQECFIELTKQMCKGRLG